MRTLRTIVALLLALLWLPASAHCLLLETTGNNELFACCTHSEPLPEHEEECATDACATVENAQYQSVLQRLSLPPLSAFIIFEFPVPLELSPASPIAALNDVEAALLPVAWQFSFRTALAPRAPSVVA